MRAAFTSGAAAMHSVSPPTVVARHLPRAIGETSMRIGAVTDFRFDIFQFPFRFNPGTNGGNVEMGLINKSYLVTLNQRGPGSDPAAPPPETRINIEQLAWTRFRP